MESYRGFLLRALVAKVEAAVGGVVALGEEFFVERSVVGGVKVEGEILRPFEEAGDLKFQHVFVESEGDEAGFAGFAGLVEVLEGGGVAFTRAIDDVVVSAPSGGRVLVGIDEKDHPVVSFGWGQSSAGV